MKKKLICIGIIAMFLLTGLSLSAVGLATVNNNSLMVSEPQLFGSDYIRKGSHVSFVTTVWWTGDSPRLIEYRWDYHGNGEFTEWETFENVDSSGATITGGHTYRKLEDITVVIEVRIKNTDIQASAERDFTVTLLKNLVNDNMIQRILEGRPFLSLLFELLNL